METAHAIVHIRRKTVPEDNLNFMQVNRLFTETVVFSPQQKQLNKQTLDSFPRDGVEIETLNEEEVSASADYGSICTLLLVLGALRGGFQPVINQADVLSKEAILVATKKIHEKILYFSLSIIRSIFGDSPNDESMNLLLENMRAALGLELEDDVIKKGTEDFQEVITKTLKKLNLTEPEIEAYFNHSITDGADTVH